MNTSPIKETSSNPEPTQTVNISKIPHLLRSLGATAILFSLYSFVMKGWQDGDDLLRYALLYGHTLLLGIIGIMNGYYLKEGKGARLLLMLALISSIAIFSILGSFIFASINPHAPITIIHSLYWHLATTQQTIIVSVISLILLLPLIIISFRVLARAISHRMVILFLLSNSALLLPIRDPAYITLISIIIAMVLVSFNVKTARQYVELKTQEGLFVMLLQYIPIATLLVRSLWLYDVTALLVTVTIVIVFIGLRQISQLLSTSNTIKSLNILISSFLAIASGLSLFTAINDMYYFDCALFSGSVLSSVMLFELSHRADGSSRLLRCLSTVAITLPLITNLLINNNANYLFAIFGLGLILLYISYQLKRSSILIAGVLLTSASTCKLVINLWSNFDINTWLLTALFGIFAISLSSLIESRGSEIKNKWLTTKQYFYEWSF